jgi:galactokinase
MIDFTAKAHGIVSLIGEHTEYNGGFVLLAPIPQHAKIFITKRKDNSVHASTSALHLPGSVTMSYKLGEETAKRNWIDYIQGATKILAALGHKISGFDIRVESNIPTGTNLSSSSALVVGALKAINKSFDLKFGPESIAHMGLKIEKEFVGGHASIANLMACTLCDNSQALHLDTYKNTFDFVPVPFEKMDLVVIYSGLPQSKGGGEAIQRKYECQEACELLGISSLRELSYRDLFRLDSLPMTLRRRARHVVTEAERVNQSIAALKAGNLKKLGEIFYESHLSMKEDFLISLPEIDSLVELFKAEPGTYGARMTGSGFGGSVVAITEKGQGRKIAETVVDAYRTRTPQPAQILVSN